MSLEHSPSRLGHSGGSALDEPGGADYWNSLIDEKVAAAFLGLEPRTMQSFRQRGSGPKYIKISSRCLRYRRVDLKTWSDSLVRRSTADPGNGADS